MKIGLGNYAILVGGVVVSCSYSVVSYDDLEESSQCSYFSCYPETASTGLRPEVLGLQWVYARYTMLV